MSSQIQFLLSVDCRDFRHNQGPIACKLQVSPHAWVEGELLQSPIPTWAVMRDPFLPTCEKKIDTKELKTSPFVLR